MVDARRLGQNYGLICALVGQICPIHWESPIWSENGGFRGDVTTAAKIV
jgi:hypothetical protein